MVAGADVGVDARGLWESSAKICPLDQGADQASAVVELVERVASAAAERVQLVGLVAGQVVVN